MPETPDVSTGVSTLPVPPAPPEDFTAFQAFRRAEERGEQPETKPSGAAVETPSKDEPLTVEEPPAETAEDTEPSGEEKQDGEEAEHEPETEGQPPKKKGGYQKKIDKLTRRSYELEGEVAALREKLAAKPAEKPPAEAAAPKAEVSDAKPKVDDAKYQDEEDPYGAWIEDCARWAWRQEVAKTAETQRKAETEAAFRTQKKAWEERMVEARSEHEDYGEKLQEVADIQLPAYVDQAIFESECGPELAYYLAGNRADLERIVKLSPLAAARELGKIEALITPGTPVSGKKPTASAPAPKVTKAPKPIEPVGGGSAGGTPSLTDDALASDFTAWRKVRRAQDR